MPSAGALGGPVGGWRAFEGQSEAAWGEELLRSLGDAASLHAAALQWRSPRPRGAQADAEPRGTKAGEELLLKSVRSFRVTFSAFTSRRIADALDGPELQRGEDDEEEPSASAENRAQGPDDAAGAGQAAWWSAPSLEAQAKEAVRKATGWSWKRSGCDVFLNAQVASSSSEAHPHGAFRLSTRFGKALWRRLAGAHKAAGTSEGLPPRILECRSELVVRYDTSRYPFPSILADLLEALPLPGAEPSDAAPMSPEEALATLHQRPLQRLPLFPQLAKAYKLAGLHVPGELREFGSAVKGRLEASEPWRAFLATYRRFVCEVCVPLCGCQRVVFQCPPTIRIVMPGAPATIRMHCDANYPVHWDGEVNFWLPVTAVSGSSAMWLESRPDVGDFRPMELQPGELLRFHGHQCRHYTQPNGTDGTRVSFDWRAIPEELCDGIPVDVIGDYPAELSGGLD